MNNFLITGLGRSGTKFLSAAMDNSSTWTVLHEPPPAIAKVEGFKVQPRFNREKYGEVNSYLRWCFLDVDVAKRGVIIRNPKEILASGCNRRDDTVEAKQKVVDVVAEGCELLEKYINTEGVELIRFEKMVSDLDYLQGIFNTFGVDDFTPTQEIMRAKINKNAKESDYSALPDDIRESFMEKCGGFIDKYYAEEEASV